MSAEESLAEIEAALAVAKQVYDTARTALEGALGRVYAKPQDAADSLLSQVDEFGPEYAVEQYTSNPHKLGEVQKSGLIPWRETGDLIKDQLPRIAAAQDRLDDLNLRRDAGRMSGTRTINIQGIDYLFDGTRGSLVRVGEPQDRIAVSMEPISRELTPTERFAHHSGSGKVQPDPLTPPRGRSR